MKRDMKNILVTGLPGTGKTTLLQRILARIEHKQGFLTREIRTSGTRTGFEIVTSDGKRKLLAGVHLDSPYRVSNYKVDVSGFEEVIQELFDFSAHDILYIDEIGKMELFSELFKKLVIQYINSGNTLLATIALKSQDPFVQEIKRRDDILLFCIDINNRNSIFETILKLVKARL